MGETPNEIREQIEEYRAGMEVNQNFRRMLTSLMGQKSPIGGSFPAIR